MVVINAINFVDGLDGLATGIVAICASCFFAFSYLLAVINGLNRAGAPSLITAVVIGLCLGFLPHNFYPAQIFMGDSGAMFLGLMISASAITLTGQVDASAITAENSGSALLPLLLPFTVLAIPLLDFAMAIVRRLRAGRSPFSADREHLHHRIMRMGLTQQRTTVVLYLWTAMFAVPTAIAAFIPIWIALLVGAVIFALSILVIKRNKNTVIIEHNRSAKVN
jgi:UDP-GlcNAc:undecaprenyl-phosphate GlcNAc-1-phosphate transferase